jgi:CDP-diacylglycerol---glycerol-3-phosphate 3-phosphatidyltransferase
VVIAASWLGKIKTALQVIAVFGLIAVTPTPLWVNLTLYAAVVATVVSGADYFFGLRRRIAEAEAHRRAARAPRTTET